MRGLYQTTGVCAAGSRSHHCHPLTTRIKSYRCVRLQRAVCDMRVFIFDAPSDFWLLYLELPFKKGGIGCSIQSTPRFLCTSLPATGPFPRHLLLEVVAK